MSNLTFDKYFMNVALAVAEKSSCARRKVGAILVRDQRIISTGYNGTPRGFVNCNEGGCPRCNSKSIQSGEQLAECLCSHAEENTIVQAAYHGVQVKNASLYTTLFPCKICAKILINAGIDEIIYDSDYPSISDVSRLFNIVGINVRRPA